MLELITQQKNMYGFANRFVSATYPIHTYQILNFEHIQDKIIDKIDEVERSVKVNQYPDAHDGNTGVGGTTLTHNMFNLFADGSLDDLKEVITEACVDYAKDVFNYEGEMYAKAWGNKLAQYRYMNKHHHKTDYDEYNDVDFALHLTVDSSPENFTVYTASSNDGANPLYMRNVSGCLNIFPSNLAHHTTPNCSKHPRYSLAMDIADASRFGAPHWIFLKGPTLD